MNLFDEAIIKKELIDFAIGKGKYFVTDIDYGEHAVIGSWINYVLPLVESKGINYVNSGIESMFEELICAENIEESIRNEILLYHLHVYYYLAKENRIEPINLIRINPEIRRILDLYVSKLKKLNDPKIGAVKDTIALIKSRGGLLLPT